MATVQKSIFARHGRIALIESTGTGLPLIMLHGSGAAKEVFVRQFDSALAEAYRLVAIDLPGHGRSDNAQDPEAEYSLDGFAATVSEIMGILGIRKAAMLGWSLGGHIAIELMGREPELLAGVMLTGAPPPGRGLLAMPQAFHLRPEMLFSSKPKFTRAQAETFARMCYGPATTPELIDSVLTSDGRARPVISRSLLRNEHNQLGIVEAATMPIAMVNGKDEPLVRLSYLAHLHYRRLWRADCQTILGAGHSPFLQQPDRFNALLGDFMADMARAYAHTSGEAATPRVA